MSGVRSKGLERRPMPRKGQSQVWETAALFLAWLALHSIMNVWARVSLPSQAQVGLAATEGDAGEGNE